MTRGWHAGYRWRALTPNQAAEILRAYAGGARSADLAVVYGVSQRTIQRCLNRAVEPTAEVHVFDRKATFVRGDDDEPVQMTPWVPA